MISYSLISLYPLICIPQSYPLETSFTSSLKRLRATNSPVKITTPSLIKRILLLRITLPSVIIHPAIVPTLETLNNSLISAVPVISSFNSGESIPSIASFKSSIAA